jgi:hypothetical protein
VHENTVIVFSKATLLMLQGCTTLTGYFFLFHLFLSLHCVVSFIAKLHYTI